MPELPWEKWYPTNWAGETGLRLCSRATRGIWFEILNTMMLRQTGSLTSTLPSFAILLFCTVEEMKVAIDELGREGVAEIKIENDSITIANRKRLRDYKIKELRRNAGSKGAATRWNSDIAKSMANMIAPTMANMIASSASASASASASEGGVGEIEKGSYHKDARTVLHVLIEATGTHFREVDTNLGIISARLKEPEVDLAGVRMMIDRQCRLWKGTEMEEYLRPATLFGKSKFDGYYAARSKEIIQSSTKQSCTMNGKTEQEILADAIM